MLEPFFLTPGPVRLLDQLEASIVESKASCLEAASAFVTLGGVLLLKEMIGKTRIRNVKLLAGLDLFITHPEALSRAIEYGWEVRVPAFSKFLFHPKLILAVLPGNNNGVLYVGSANITNQALTSNLESCWVGICDLSAPKVGYERIWSTGTVCSAEMISKYSKEYIIQNARRSAEHLAALYRVEMDLPANGDFSTSAVQPIFASTIWTELTSFTGDWTFQVQIPPELTPLLQILTQPFTSGRKVTMVCDDELAREMIADYYHHNRTYRLNVPNRVPNIDWVRNNKSGILAISKVFGDKPSLRLSVHTEPRMKEEMISRSRSINCFYSNELRCFGWY